MGDISEGGLRLRTQAPLAPGERVRIRLTDGAAGLDLQAAVVWRQGPGPEAEPGVGLRFDGNDASASAALRRHVARLTGNAA